MTENNMTNAEVKTMDDLLDNPFNMNEPLLPKEMQTEQSKGQVAVKLLDRLSPEEQEKAKQLAEQIPLVITKQSSHMAQMHKMNYHASPIKCWITYKAKISVLLVMC